MTKLSDAQLVVLSAACQRDDRCVYPLTTKAKGEAAAKILKSLLKKKLIEEVSARRPAHQGGSISYHVWREGKDGPLTLRVTDAACQALGIERDDASAIKDADPADRSVGVGDPALAEQHEAQANAASWPSGSPRKRAKKVSPPAAAAVAAKRPARGKKAAAPARTTRADSKQARLIEMLKRAKGASIAEIAETFGWQPHTVRGAIAGALKKKLGLDVTSEKTEGRGRIYRIAG